MTAPVATDFSGYAPLREKARANDPQALRAAAQQFEALFTQMLLKSMRDASLGDDLLGSEQGDFYRDLFDQQVALSLSSGKGLGLADMMVRQMGAARENSKGSAPFDFPASAKAAAPPPPMPKSMGSVPIDFSSDAPGSTDRKDSFIQSVLPHARTTARALGVDAAALVAQSALESNWGRSAPAAGNNLFGMKARPGDAATLAPTTEYRGGIAHAEKAAFKAYASVAESFADYARRIGTADRYAGARNAGADVARFARGLQDGGYATDPAYAKKLDALATDPSFRARVQRAAQRLGIPL